MEAVCYTLPYGTLCPDTIIQENSMKKLHSALLAAALVAPCSLLADVIDPADYAKTFDIKFAGYAGTTELTDFPALIRLSAARNSFDYAKCAADGSDLRFSDSDGNLIPHEIDTWNPNGESTVWVKVPTLTHTTVIRAFYGYRGAGQPPAVTATDVWTNGYVGVWHMSAAALTDSQQDSTNNRKNLATNPDYRSGMECGVGGAVGHAVKQGKGGVNTGGFSVGDSDGVFDGFNAATLELWTFQTAYVSRNSYLFNKQLPGNNTQAYNFQQRAASTEGRICAYFYKTNSTSTTIGNGDIWQGNSTLGTPLNEWTHQVARWNGNNGRTTGFLNGNQIYNAVADKNKGFGIKVNGNLYVGNFFPNQSYVFPGTIDEVRISNVARSDDWVVATHDTVAKADFVSYEDSNDWTQYAHKFSISFPGVTDGSTLENFPVLVKVSTNDIAGFSYADCAKAGGGDLRFTDGNSTEPLPSEVEVWNTNGTSLIWVKIPTLTKNTRIIGYYGWNLAPAVVAADVWDPNFVGVWHMNAAQGSSSQKDATANNKTVTCPANYADAVQSGVEGKVGLAARCGLRSDKLGGFSIADSGHFDGFGAITIEAWTFQEALPSDAAGAIVYKMKASGTWVTAWGMSEATSGKIGFVVYDDSGTYMDSWKASPGFGAPAAPSLNEWHYHARRWSGTTGLWSLTQDSSTTSGTQLDPSAKMQSAGGYLCIGNRAENSNGTTPFPGIIDEVRISNVARSDAWVKATYDTIAENATFTRYGTVGDNIECTVVLFR